METCIDPELGAKSVFSVEMHLILCIHKLHLYRSICGKYREKHPGNQF